MEDPRRIARCASNKEAAPPYADLVLEAVRLTTQLRVPTAGATASFE